MEEPPPIYEWCATCQIHLALLRVSTFCPICDPNDAYRSDPEDKWEPTFGPNYWQTDQAVVTYASLIHGDEED